MIPKNIQALFYFIDYLDSYKSEFIKLIPLINEQKLLDKKRQELKPLDNYKKRQQYTNIQKEISEKLPPIETGILTPILNKLKELEIWSGDDTFASIWNNNISAISDIKQNFTDEDVDIILQHKQKYLSFRNETNTDFLCLDFAFNELDEVLKEFFDFFKDTTENEFASFEQQTIKVSSVKDAANILKENRNVRVAIPINIVSAKPKAVQENNQTNIQIGDIVSGHKIQTGDISGNNGQIVIGNNNNNNQNINETKGDDKIAKKSFKIQKWQLVVGIIAIIVAIALAILFSK